MRIDIRTDGPFSCIFRSRFIVRMDLKNWGRDVWIIQLLRQICIKYIQKFINIIIYYECSWCGVSAWRPLLTLYYILRTSLLVSALDYFRASNVCEQPMLLWSNNFWNTHLHCNWIFSPNLWCVCPRRPFVHTFFHTHNHRKFLLHEWWLFIDNSS